MSVYKKVVNTFVFIGKAGKSACLAQSREFFITAGKKLMGIALMAYIPDNCIIRAVKNSKKLMGIALMAYIPDNCIIRAVKNSVKCDSKLYNTKITRKVAAVFSDNIYNSCTDFLSQLLDFLLRKLFYVFRRMNLRK